MCPVRTYHMHGTALASGTSALLSRQLGKDALNRDTHQIGPSVHTIGGNYVILLAHGSLHSDCNSFLARVQVTEATHDLFLVEIAGRGFETANGLHVAVHREGIVAGDGEFRFGFAIEVVGFKRLLKSEY